MMTDAKINAGINANERIDDLCRDNLRLIQNTDVFCFGMDAVLLSTFAKAGKNQKVLDMGTGNGVIPILMQAKNPGSMYTGLEIQDISYDLAVRNVELNSLSFLLLGLNLSSATGYSLISFSSPSSVTITLTSCLNTLTLDTSPFNFSGVVT